jgi:DNA-binding IclR family transcriptional regulator
MRGNQSGDASRTGVKAIEVAGRILDLLARTEQPVALRDLAAAGQMSPGKAHRYLASFVASGLARQDPGTRRYALGPLSMRLGLAALNSHQPLRDAIALMRDLRNWTRHSCCPCGVRTGRPWSTSKTAASRSS